MDYENTLDDFGLNRVLLTSELAVLWAYSSGEIGLDHILCDDTSLYGVEVLPTAPVLFQNNVVGHVRSVRYDRTRRAVLVYTSHNLPVEMAPYLIGRTTLGVEQVGCSLCLTFLTHDDTPCRCLMRSDPLLVRKIVVRSVSFWDVRNDEVSVADARKGLLETHFSGPMSYLEVLDPI